MHLSGIERMHDRSRMHIHLSSTHIRLCSNKVHKTIGIHRVSHCNTSTTI